MNTVKLYGAYNPDYIEQYAIFGEGTHDNPELYDYRYALSRTWDKKLPRMLMVLLNPSTANQDTVDPTNTRGIIRAKEYGFGSLCFVNLFAYRSPSPKVMKSQELPIGKSNDDIILDEAKQSDLIIASWGTHGSHLNRDKEVLELLKDYDLHALDVTKHGHPKHMLYIPYSKKPVLFKGE